MPSRAEYLKEKGLPGRALRKIAAYHRWEERSRAANVRDRIHAMKRNVIPSSRPWALTSEQKLALESQQERFADLLARLPRPWLP